LRTEGESSFSSGHPQSQKAFLKEGLILLWTATGNQIWQNIQSEQAVPADTANLSFSLRSVLSSQGRDVSTNLRGWDINFIITQDLSNAKWSLDYSAVPCTPYEEDQSVNKSIGYKRDDKHLSQLGWLLPWLWRVKESLAAVHRKGPLWLGCTRGGKTWGKLLDL
jgi:hypothetical protein